MTYIFLEPFVFFAFFVDPLARKIFCTHDLSKMFMLYPNVECKRQWCRHNQSGLEAEVDQWVLTCYIGTVIRIYDMIERVQKSLADWAG